MDAGTPSKGRMVLATKALIEQAVFVNGEPSKYTKDDLDRLLVVAYERGVSDILMQSSDQIRISLEGEWLPLGMRELLASEVQMILTHTNTANSYAQILSGHEQIYRYEVKKDRATIYGFRCCATGMISASAGEAGLEIVMRSIPAVAPPLSSLGLEPELIAALVPTNGLVLVTGPTGSGKSTTLSGVLRHILCSPPGRHILTYENPVEFILKNSPNRVGVVAQSEIPKHLPSFAAGVANALRRKGEVILIGEARDEATIRGVIEAAQTGHLVYSTVHTNDVPSTITRMADSFGIDQSWPVALKLIEATRLIVHQRLAPGPNGGRRVAVREFLTFSEDVRRTLMAAGPYQMQIVARELVQSEGQSLVKHALRLLDEGKIDPFWVESLTAQYQAEAETLKKIAVRDRISVSKDSIASETATIIGESS